MSATLDLPIRGIYWLDAREGQLPFVLSQLQQWHIPLIDVGKQLANYLQGHPHNRHLSSQAEDFLKKLLAESAQVLPKQQVPMVAIQNLGLLTEPSLKLNPALLLELISKQVTVIMVWEGHLLSPNCFSWTSTPSPSSLLFNTRIPQPLFLPHASV